MRIVNTHLACSLPPRARAGAIPLVVIIVVAVVGAAILGHGTAALIAVIMAVLAAAMEQLVRTAMQYWMLVA